jgi:hypothetical protein
MKAGIANDKIFRYIDVIFVLTVAQFAMLGTQVGTQVYFYR